jgi:glycosyltransferase involved in cell wall biosynthesis
LVLLEAMAAGMAIITTDQTGCREVVSDTAIQVPPGDPTGIRNALESLVADRELREKLSKATRTRLEENFGWPSVAKRYVSTYLELTSPVISNSA